MRVVAGTARGVTLKTPDGMKTRPTTDRVKEAMFSILHFDLPGAKVLDLFGGTGQLGIEALSRGAGSCVFVDDSDKACQLIRENLKRTKFEAQAKVIRGDYLQFLRTTGEKFDIILLDPPYAEVFLENCLNLITEIDILQTDGIIVTERPVEKELSMNFDGFSRSKDYKYGNTVVTLYRKNSF
jgi:16S rRNA (guanine(966)-N(2))-methyltransferase RsmD